MLKDMEGEPKEEIYRVKSGSVLSLRTSVSLELGHVVVFSNLEALQNLYFA